MTRNWGHGRSRAAARRRSLREAKALASVCNLDPYGDFSGEYCAELAPGGAIVWYYDVGGNARFAGYFGARRMCGPGWRVV